MLIMNEEILYKKLIDYLLEYIKQNLKVGDFLPSERTLVENLNLSRTTVRLAMKELENMNLIKSIPGKGRVVSNLLTNINLAGMFSFSEEVKSMNKKASTKIIKLQQLKADSIIASKLNINIGDSVAYLMRLRLADDIPMIIEDTFLPEKIVSGILKKNHEKKSLYNIMNEEYEIIIKCAEETIFATLISEVDAGFLNITIDDPILEIYRTGIDINDRVVEYTRSRARSDMFNYRVIHYNQSI